MRARRITWPTIAKKGAAYAGLGRAVLPRQTAPPLLTILRVQLATKAVGNVVPGGWICTLYIGWPWL